jgi:hypothetical protein
MADYAHYVATVTGAAQRLSTLLDLDAAEDVPFEHLTMQADGANGNPIFIGGPGVSATSYASRIPASAAGVPHWPPLWFELTARPVKLSEIFVMGTVGEKLHIGGFPW